MSMSFTKQTKKTVAAIQEGLDTEEVQIVELEDPENTNLDLLELGNSYAVLNEVDTREFREYDLTSADGIDRLEEDYNTPTVSVYGGVNKEDDILYWVEKATEGDSVDSVTQRGNYLKRL